MSTMENIDEQINEVALDNANALEESMPHIPVEEKVEIVKEKLSLLAEAEVNQILKLIIKFERATFSEE
jgi:2-phospho-L-lactate guanylyltransferase (CobY/MobA/RfbA family)